MALNFNTDTLSIDLDEKLSQIRSLLGLILPPQLRRSFFSPKAHLFFLEGGEDRILEQSLFGEERIVKGASSQETDTLPRQYILAENDIYLTQFHSPSLSANELDQAVSLRLEKLCPIPVDTCLYDYSAKPLDEGRLEITIAIAKREKVTELTKGFSTNKPYSIGYLDEEQNSYNFYTSKNSQKKGHRGAYAILGVACILLFIFGLFGQIEKQQKDLSHRQTVALQTLKEIKSTSNINETIYTQINQSGSIRLPVLLSKISNTKIPEGALIEEINVNASSLSVIGFISEDNIPSPPMDNFQINETNRPGFKAFTISQPILLAPTQGDAE